MLEERRPMEMPVLIDDAAAQRAAVGIDEPAREPSRAWQKRHDETIVGARPSQEDALEAMLAVALGQERVLGRRLRAKVEAAGGIRDRHRHLAEVVGREQAAEL